MDIYSVRRRSTAIFIVAAILIVAFFMFYSSQLVSELTEQEKERMELWADATKRLIGSEGEGEDIDFMLSVIEANHNIPVIVTDENGEILQYRNIREEDRQKMLNTVKGSNKVIPIEISQEENQFLYYQDSQLLRKLSLFPYIQTVVMLVFVITVYFAVTATKRAEQNKVWVGLSKETAHQLGTPISSLMAWIDIMKESDNNENRSIANEMEKDTSRLASVASRFSKIGSYPDLNRENINDTVFQTVEYMKRRVSSNIKWEYDDKSNNANVLISRSLTEWVIECLIKNSVDSMKGKGEICISLGVEGEKVWIEIKDSGSGIPQNKHKRVFMPGYTTKERGWGLGLTLAKRIIEEYEKGKIFVRWSSPGKGTTMRIELPAAI